MSPWLVLGTPSAARAKGIIQIPCAAVPLCRPLSGLPYNGETHANCTHADCIAAVPRVLSLLRRVSSLLSAVSNTAC